MELIASQNSDVAILGGIVIRRPRHAEAIAGVRREAAVLPRLHERLTLPVPEMQLVELQGAIITLHQRLPGEPLRNIQNLSKQTQSQVAAQLGGFLQSLSKIEPDELSDIELPNIDQHWWTAFLDKAEYFVFPEVAATLAEVLRCQIRSHFDQLPHLPCVLRHGDFGSGNILWDGKEAITGIIDFGSLGWGDPGWDAAGLVASYGYRFAEYLAPTYPTIEPLLERARFYRLMFALMDAVAGAEHADRKLFDDGLAALRQLVESN